MLTLAVGIGATATLISLVNGILVKPLPYPNADRLVQIEQTFGSERRPGSVSPANFGDWQSQNHTLEGIAAYQEVGRNLDL